MPCLHPPCQDAKPLSTEWVLPLLEGQRLVSPMGPLTLSLLISHKGVSVGEQQEWSLWCWGDCHHGGGAVGDDGVKMMGKDVGDSGRGRVGMTTRWWAWLYGGGRSRAAP